MVANEKELSEYALRLAHALSPEVSGMTAVELADKLGVTRQAIDKFFRPGGSGEMKAANHVKTARILGVDSAWLALGEGVPRPSDFQVRWPERKIIEQYRQLNADDQDEFAAWLESRVKLNQDMADAPHPFPKTPKPPAAERKHAKTNRS